MAYCQGLQRALHSFKCCHVNWPAAGGWQVLQGQQLLLGCYPAKRASVQQDPQLSSLKTPWAQ